MRVRVGHVRNRKFLTDVDPTVRLFVTKELCAVDREHQDCVVVLDSAHWGRRAIYPVGTL